jgi:hypothetical protein
VALYGREEPRFSGQQIAQALRQAEQGAAAAEVCRKLQRVVMASSGSSGLGCAGGIIREARRARKGGPRAEAAVLLSSAP